MEIRLGRGAIPDSFLARGGVIVLAVLVSAVALAAPAYAADQEAETLTAAAGAVAPDDNAGAAIAEPDSNPAHGEDDTAAGGGVDTEPVTDPPDDAPLDLEAPIDTPSAEAGTDTPELGPITVEVGTQLTGIVVDDLGQPAVDICAVVQSEDEQILGFGLTGSDGRYTTTAVAAGSMALYLIDCRDSATLASTVWNNSGVISLDPSLATRIDVDGVVPVLGDFDQVLPRGTDVSGTVTSVAGPVGGACVFAIVADGGGEGYAGIAQVQSGPDGSYLLPLLPPVAAWIGVARCDAVPAVIDGVYSDSSPVLVPDPADGTPFSLDPNAPITGLELVVELGVTISGAVTASGSPLADVCVSLVDGTTGNATTVVTDPDGLWATTVPPGSYVAQATDCQDGRGLAGGFYDGTADPASAQAIVGAGNEVITGIDFSMTASGAVMIRGRVVTDTGGTPQACVLAFLPNGDIDFVGMTDVDGFFQIAVNPGAYLVALVSCEPEEDLPLPIVDPDDPAKIYPVQWWTGTPIDFAAPWVAPAWAIATAGSGLDLGTLCLSPCNPQVAPVPPTSPGTPPIGPPTAPPVPTASVPGESASDPPSTGAGSRPTLASISGLAAAPSSTPDAASDDAGTPSIDESPASSTTGSAAQAESAPSSVFAWIVASLIILAAVVALYFLRRHWQRAA